MQADIYVKQLCLFLYSRKLLSKKEVHHYYTFFIKRRKTNIYYAFVAFKKNTRLDLLKRIALYTKIVNNTVNIKQRLIFSNRIRVLNKSLIILDYKFGYNNYATVGSLFAYFRSMLNSSETKLILVNRLKHFKTQTQIKQYFTFH